MKKIILLLTAAAITAVGTQPAQAGDKEWATAGKVLTGVVAGAVLAKTIHHHRSAPVYTQTTTTTYTSTAYRTSPVVVQQPVVVRQSAPVVVQQPVVVQKRVVYKPATVVYKSAPVVYQPAPVVVRHTPVVCPTPVVVHRPVFAPVRSGFSFHARLGGNQRRYGHHRHGHHHPGRGHGRH